MESFSNTKKIERQLRNNYLCNFLICLGLITALFTWLLWDSDAVLLVLSILAAALPCAIICLIACAVKRHRVFDRALPYFDSSTFEKLTDDLYLSSDYLAYYHDLNYIFVSRNEVTDITTTEQDGKKQAVFTLKRSTGLPFSYIYEPAADPGLYEKIAGWTRIQRACPVCGALNPADAVYCGSCGAELRPVMPQKEKKNTGTGIAIVLLIIAFIGVVTAGIVMGM